MAPSLESLSALLRAPSKKFIDEFFVHVHDGTFSGEVSQQTAAALEIDHKQLDSMKSAAQFLVETVVRDQLSPTQITALFPTEFEKKLKELIAAILSQRLALWKESAAQVQLTLPKFVDVDWRADLKVASDSAKQMGQPTLFVELTVQDTPTHKHQMPQQSKHTIEFTKESLQTMLEGLGKIRDQLGSLQ
eukprot:TRINITY_DN3146_c0_g1_i1.p1 TRINITY_DN3146_c0_g1~~TRINITY_DN3146_c0_g1_i1.p1  ORF type:complete len:190 (-),score=54.72 TRINITY_DN3146_c0_g1_i1:134-703(-)